MAAAGTWGILRNALQEFPAVQWAGMDADPSVRTANTPPAESDAFGVAARGVQLCNMAAQMQRWGSVPNGVISSGRARL